MLCCAIAEHLARRLARRRARPSGSLRALVAGLPFISHDAHAHEVHVAAVAPHVAAQPAFFHETAREVAADRALVIAPYAQPHTPQVTQVERVLQQQPYRLAAVTSAQVLVVPDTDAEFCGTIG